MSALAKEYKSLINTDAPASKPITKITRELAVILSKKHRGSARVAMGRFPTDEEYNARRKKILNTDLP